MSSPVEKKNNKIFTLAPVVYDHAVNCASCKKKLVAITSNTAFEILDKMVEARQLRNYIQTHELEAKKEEHLSKKLNTMLTNLRESRKVLSDADNNSYLEIAQHSVPTMTIYF